jgi:hypothetical protein
LAVFALSAGVGCGSGTASGTQNQGSATFDPNMPGATTTAPGGATPFGGAAGTAGGTTSPGGTGMTTSPPGGTTTTPGGTGMIQTPPSGAPTSHSIGNTPLPCNIKTAVAKNCNMCHGANPIGGAPMSLLTYEDFQADHVVQTYVPLKGMTMKVYQLAKIRINDHMSPMPPGGTLSTDDFSTLDTWLGSGAPAGTTADAATCMTTPPTGGDGAVVGAAGDGTYGPLTPAPDETCYQLAVHGSTDMVDDSKFTIPAGEEYVQFYFDVPWDTGSLGTRYGTVFDNQAVLHHWLLFTTNSTDNDGYYEVAPLPTLIGDDATLLAGWAVGGTNLALPSDAAFELPPKGSKLNAQWHFYNTTGSDQMDHSAVQVCTVKAGGRPHVATITWTGDEDLGGNKWTGGAGMPPHQMSTFTGTCNPLREGMNTTDPIHILGFWPHMHKLGVQMDFAVNHMAGGSEMIFSKPFDFNHQIHYIQAYDLAAGDTITTTCHFNNTTDMGVPFGESSDTEMCYGFVMSWPAHAFENHVSSLIGASNTCW